MKLITLLAFVFACSFSSCVSSKVLEKPAYINNETVNLPNEKANNITIVCVSMAGEKGLYEKIAQNVQAYLSARNIASDMLFFDATENTAAVNKRIHQSTKGYYLIFEKTNTSYQKDELNNEMMVKQLPCSLQKSTGERIADIRIGISNNSTDERLGKTIAGLVTEFLSKKSLLN